MCVCVCVCVCVFILGALLFPYRGGRMQDLVSSREIRYISKIKNRIMFKSKTGYYPW